MEKNSVYINRNNINVKKRRKIYVKIGVEISVVNLAYLFEYKSYTNDF